MAAQPLGGIDDARSARRELDPEIGARERGGGDRRLLPPLRGVEQPLPPRAAAPIRPVVEEPDGGEAAAPPVGPFDRHVVHPVRNAGDEPLRASGLRASARARFDDCHCRPFRWWPTTLRQLSSTIQVHPATAPATLSPCNRPSPISRSTSAISMPASPSTASSAG